MCASFDLVVYRKYEERRKGMEWLFAEPSLRSSLNLRLLILSRFAAELPSNVGHGLLLSVLCLDLRHYRFLHSLLFALKTSAGFPVLLVRLRPSCAGDGGVLRSDAPFEALFPPLE